MTEYIAIVGSRPPKHVTEAEWDAYEAMLLKADAFVDSLDPSWVLVSGGAEGTDKRVERRARSLGMAVESWRPRKDQAGTWRVMIYRWDRDGAEHQLWLPELFAAFPAAAFWRNGKVVGRATKGVKAFHFGDSRGTADTIRKAKAAGKLLL